MRGHLLFNAVQAWFDRLTLLASGYESQTVLRMFDVFL